MWFQLFASSIQFFYMHSFKCSSQVLLDSIGTNASKANEVRGAYKVFCDSCKTYKTYRKAYLSQKNLSAQLQS